VPWYSYDQDKARALLIEAGYPNGFEITLSFRNVVRGYLPHPDQVAQEIQAQLAEVGVQVKLVEMESAAFLESVSAGQEAMYLLGWGADYPDASNFYDYHFASVNSHYFGNPYPDLGEYIKAAATTSDFAKRQELYDIVNGLLKEYIPMIPVAHGASATVFEATVSGAQASPLGSERFAYMDNGAGQLVWMQNGEPAALWCGDETDGEALRACVQVYDALLSFETNGVGVQPGLAQSWEVNEAGTEWTFHLRPGVYFHNGARLDAGDVLASFVAQWDAISPLHSGRTGFFEYFTAYFGAFLNAP
jgi:ABC-type transport system substrate-binding protein